MGRCRNLISALFLGSLPGCFPNQSSLLTPRPVTEVTHCLQAPVGEKISPQTCRAQEQEAAKSQQYPPGAFSTVNSPDLNKRSISLAECIALALENGRTGDFFDGPGQRSRSSVSGLRLSTAPSSATDSIRVFAYDPAIAATEVEESLSRFDVWSESGFFWNRSDQPSRLFSPTPFEDFTSRNKVDGLNFRTGLFKRLSTGGFAGMQFQADREDNFVGPGAQILNPGSRPLFELLFEQPLLQGAGVLINQVRDNHPGAVHQTFPDFGRPPGILLVRISEKQTQLEFERQVHELVFRVEEAYWQLYCAYWDLYSSDNGMKQAHAAWQIAKARFDAGGIGVEDLAMIEEQYHYFRNQRLQALGRGQPGRPGVLEAERLLRFVIGLKAEDGTRLIPADQPRFVAYQPDMAISVVDAQNFRPELRQVDEAVRAAQLAIFKAQDRLLPDLRFVSSYGVNGLGQTVGRGLEDLTTNPNHEWEMGLRLQFPLGYRGGHAETARARLQMTQTLHFLEDQKEKLIFSLQRSYRELTQYQEQYRIRQSQRLAAAKQLQARNDKYKAGGDPKQPGSFIDLLLRAQRNWVDALREEHAALCDYRTAIADFERQKGTILQFSNVTIAHGPVPPEVIPQASKHLRSLRERRQTLRELATTADAASFGPASDLLEQPHPLGETSNTLPAGKHAGAALSEAAILEGNSARGAPAGIETPKLRKDSPFVPSARLGEPLGQSPVGQPAVPPAAHLEAGPILPPLSPLDTPPRLGPPTTVEQPE